MHATDIVGYTYRAAVVCPDCVRTEIAPTWDFRRDPRTAEEILDHVASMRGLDRMDESSYDSDDFPKVIFASSVETSERCEVCSREIVETDQPADYTPDDE